MSVAIKRNFTIPSTSAIGATELYLTSSVASTTIGTGALQVAGGAGISGVVSLGGELKLFNGSFYTGFDSAATANTTYIWPATSPSTGTSVLSSDAAGNLSWVLMSASGSGLTLNDLSSTIQYLTTSISGSGFTIASIGSTHTFYIGLAGNASTGLISGTDQTIFGLKTFASGIAITSGTASTSIASGALVVTGGVGIGASVNIGGKVGINTGVYTGTFNITTPSASTIGLAVRGSVSQTADYLQVLSSTGTTSFSINSAGRLSWPSSSAAQIYNTSYSTQGRIVVSGNLYVNPGPFIVDTGAGEASMTSTSITFGGVGWGVYGSPARVSTNNAVRIQPTSTSVVPLVVQLQNASWTSGNAFEIQNNGVLKFNVDYAGSTSILSTVGSGSTTSGALVVSGGVGIGGSLNIYRTTTANDNVLINSAKEIRFYNSSNTFYSGIKAGITTSSTTFTLPIVDGSANQVLLTNGSAALGFTTALLGLNGLNTASQTFTTSISGSGFTIGSSSSTHTFYIGLAGNASTGLISGAAQTIFGLKAFASGVAVTSGTASTSTTTGDLIVAGGVGIGGSLWTSTSNLSSISGVSFLNNVVTSGVWAGTAISAVNGGTGQVSYTTGDILYASSSTVLGKITAGSAGSVLTSAGTGATPYWAAAALGSGSGLTLNGLTSATQFFATSIAGSGFTIGSTGSTHTYYIALAGNASTGLISGAAQTIFGLKTFASGIAITSGTASTNTITGALTVAGGVGITGQLSVNTIALGSTSVSVTPSMVFTGSAGTVISMSVLSDTTLAWEGSSGQLFSIDNNLSSGEIFSVSDISGLPIISASAGQSIYLNEFGGFTQVGNGLASTNTTTGSLRVVGGVGITGSLYLGSPLLVPSGGTGLTTYTTGDILHASSSTTLGRIAAGTAGSILTSAGTGATPYWAAATGSTLAIAGTNNGDIQYKSASALGASSALNFDASTSTFKLTGFPIEAVSSSSANVKLLGGSVSWNGNINGTMLAINTANSYVGDLFNAQIGGTSRFKVSYTGAVSIGNSYTLPVTDGTANQVLQTNGSGTVSWANSVISSAQYNIGYYASAGAALTGSSTFTNNTSTGVVSIGHATSSTGFSSGALVVTGGVGISGSLNIGVDLGISGLTTLTYTSEKLNTKTSATGTVTHDLSTGSVFYHSSISNNFTANITNVPTTNDRAIGVTLVLAQGVTPYMSTALQIDGNAQTIKWVNNSTPTGTASKVDIVGFSLIRTGSAWTVLGQYSTYG
jgi:hypothetical protein